MKTRNEFSYPGQEYEPDNAMTASHLPWTVLACGTHIVDPNAWTVAKCIGDNAEGDARLIVRAVNSHDRLLVAARDAADTLEANGFMSGQLRAAIAAAEEQAL